MRAVGRMLSVLFLLASCSEEKEPLPPPPDPTGPACAKLDILFVVDDSGGMEEEQAALVAGFPALVEALAELPGGQPDLHIGVVSTSMGARGQNVSGCMGAGDDGVLQNTPRAPGCEAPSDRYIADDGNGTRNFTGTLEDAFACIAPLGTAGCGFEQPLAALRRALDVEQAANGGFVRSDAALLVVILADEDDCSAGDDPSDGDLYDPTQDGINSELGFMTSFRCTEFGIECDGQSIDREPGSYTSCVPRTDSYLGDPAAYADAVADRKAGQAVMVATISGDPEPVAVELTTSTQRCGDATTPCVPSLAPSCNSALGSAAPGVRLAAFTSHFATSSAGSICSETPLAGLIALVEEGCGD